MNWGKGGGGGVGSSLSVHLLCEKNCLKCQMNFCFEPNPAYKGVFLLKRCRHFFFHLTIFYEINCKYLHFHCVKNTDLLC